MKNKMTGGLWVIDYLQAIRKENEDDRGYQKILQECRTFSYHKNMRVIILSQVKENILLNSLDCFVGGSSITQYFSHVLHIEHSSMVEEEKRNIVLLKSIHYQRQNSVMKFDIETFRFN